MEPRQVLALLRQHGRNTISFQTLMPGLRYFQSHESGYIAYVHDKHVWLAVGDPVCAPQDRMLLAHHFRKAAHVAKADCCFLHTSQEMRDIFDLMAFGTIKIGEEGIINVPEFSTSGNRMDDVRYGCNHAAKSGVSVKQVGGEADLLAGITALTRQWSKMHKVNHFSFLLSMNPLLYAEEKRIFVALHDSKVVGYLTGVPIYQRNGLYFEDIIVSKDAPNGTGKLLVVNAIEALQQQGVAIATLGASPLANITPDDNQDYPLANKALALLREHGNTFYNYKSLTYFKQSFQPHSYEPHYFCFYPPRLKRRMIQAVIKAYSPGGIPRLVLSRISKELRALRLRTQRAKGPRIARSK